MTKLIFESKKNEIYEVVCEQIQVCNNDECHTIIKFSDNKLFDVDTQRTELFDYLKQNYKQIVEKNE